MTRCRTFRYAPRIHIRALEIFHRAGGDCSTREIIETLALEGHGDVSRNAVERWLREAPTHRATQAAALGQRLRREAEAANGDKDVIASILASARQIADVLAVAAKRAADEIPAIEIRSVEDLARVASSLRDLVSASVEGFRVVEELRKLSSDSAEKAESTENAQASN